MQASFARDLLKQFDDGVLKLIKDRLPNTLANIDKQTRQKRSTHLLLMLKA